jgi:hypothetical protein
LLLEVRADDRGDTVHADLMDDFLRRRLPA